MSAPRPLRVLVCPQEFKGSLDAFEATAAIARGVREALAGRPAADIEVVERPMADGGPGTGAILSAALGVEVVSLRVRGAYGDPVDARYGIASTAEGDLAVIECAEAVGLGLVPPEVRDPAWSSSEGVASLIRDALGRGVRRVIVCVGGTATMDGGAGVARGLGLRMLDADGQDLPPGGMHLVRLDRIEAAAPPALTEAVVRIAVDARNPLTGPEGAVAVYGSQKGLADWQAPALDAAIARWARAVRDHLGHVVDVPGAGTGGGITAGVLAAHRGARIESGAALVADLTGLSALVASADLVVTGEGALDVQTAYGKTVGHVADLARDAGVPCVAVAGVVTTLPPGIEDAEALVAARTGDDLDAVVAAVADAMAHAAERASGAAGRLVRRWLAHHGA
ncbi:MAG: glycerate kinase [Dehalococcoidia bacterium]|nr:glycerate kinase [Dehalococcoidia bacterium]